jgi:hypothetical protein
MTGPASVRTAASSTLCDEVDVSAVGTQADTVRSALDNVTHHLTTNRYPSCGPRHRLQQASRLRQTSSSISMGSSTTASSWASSSA